MSGILNTTGAVSGILGKSVLPDGVTGGSGLTSLSAAAVSGVLPVGVTGGSGLDETPLSNRNMIINGAMQVSQRGTVTGATNNVFGGPDRFVIAETGALVVTMSKDSDAPAGQGFADSMKLDVTTADSSLAAGDLAYLGYKFEGQDLQALKKGTSNALAVTLSFWIKTTITGTYIIQLYDNDNTRHISKSYTVSVSNTWEKKTITFAGDTTGAFGNDNLYSLQVYWWLAAGSTYTGGTLATSWAGFSATNAVVGQVNAVNDAANNILITGVQLEAGSVATPFEHRGYSHELTRCQRYCTSSFDVGVTPAHGAIDYYYDTGVPYADNTLHTVIHLRTKMRATPTVIAYGTEASGSLSGNKCDIYDGTWSECPVATGGTTSQSHVSWHLTGAGATDTGCLLQYNYLATAEM